jgi:hypothetical protein
VPIEIAIMEYAKAYGVLPEEVVEKTTSDWWEWWNAYHECKPKR